MKTPKLRDVLLEHYPSGYGSVGCACGWIGSETDWAVHVEMSWKLLQGDAEPVTVRPKPVPVSNTTMKYSPEEKPAKPTSSIIVPPIPGKK